MPRFQKLCVPLAALAAVLLFTCARAGAQVQLSIAPINQVSNTNFDLTTEGPLDWIKWGQDPTTNSPRFDHSATGAGQIGTWTLLRSADASNTFFDNSSDGNNNVSFSWENGAPTLTATNQIGNVFIDTGTADSTGSGFAFTTTPLSPAGRLRFYVTNYLANLELDAVVRDSGGNVLASKSDSSWINNDQINAPIFTGYHDVNFAGLTTGDTLQLALKVAQDNGTDVLGHGSGGIMGAALSPIPEPASLGALALGAGLLLTRRRSTI